VPLINNDEEAPVPCPTCNAKGKVYLQVEVGDEPLIASRWVTCPDCRGYKTLTIEEFEKVEYLH